MKLKLIKRRFGVQAPRLAIRPRMPWYLRWLGIACGSVAAAGLLWVAYDYGRAAVWEQSRVETAPAVVSAQSAPATSDDGSQAELAGVLRELQIERAAAVDLAKQLKSLANENAQLKEQIAILQTVSAQGAKKDGISVSSARVEPSPGGGEYTYRIVLVQTGARDKPFQGKYELVVNLVEDGVRKGISIPEATEAASAYQLDFRLHQRIDGTFKVAPGAEVRSVQLRVFEGKQTQPKIMQTVSVS